MNKLLFSLLLFPLVSFAQTYPFDEGFAGIPSGSLPTGWSGDMKVQADHGLNDLKGMTADIGGNDVVDSAITPWIGPLDNNTEVYFWYRIVDQFIYPSTEKHLNGKDLFTISYSTDSVNYTTIYTIDSSNHLASLNFKKVIFPITTLGGQVVKFKLYAKHGGGGSYFFDVDSIKVRQNTGTSTNDLKLNRNSLIVYPNPSTGSEVYVQVSGTKETDVILLDISGREILRQSATANQSIIRLNTSQLLPGIYFVRYATLTRKLLVE
jgi:hypothetical protein